MHAILIGFLIVLAAGIGLFSVSVAPGGRSWWVVAAALVLLVLTAALAGDSWAGLLLLDLAELAAVALIRTRGTPEAAAAARSYLYVVVPAIVCTLVGFALLTGAGAGKPATIVVEKLAVGLIVIGFALKLGLVPFTFWLPRVAASSSPMTSALIISVVDIAVFAELAALRESAPWLFGDYAPLWAVMALVSFGGGVLLALAQTDLKRMLAFSTIGDTGLLLLGLVAGGPAGLSGAWLGMLNHALSKAILFGAVGVAESRTGQTLTLDTRGLAATCPIAGGCFVIAALGFIGVPPGFGFAAYWRLYLAGMQYGGPLLITIMFAISALDLLCYARAIHRTWFGPLQFAIKGRPALLASAVLAILTAATVALGCWPALVTGVSVPFGALAMVR